MCSLSEKQIAKLEEIIGYKFNDKELIVKAMTHTSYANENGTGSYQRMEFFGDSILEYVASEWLMNKYPNATEGELTVLRSKIVSKTPLANYIDIMHIDDFILTGKYYDPSEKNRSDIYEAIIAAIHYDKGLEEAKNFIIRSLAILADGVKMTDYKSLLFEYASKAKVKVEFILVDKKGSDHAPIFFIHAFYDGEVLGRGVGNRKVKAEQEAARHACKRLEIKAQ